VRVDGGIIGLTDDYELTPALSRFLVLNQDLILRRLEHIEATLGGYRQHYRREYRTKANVLTYRFFTHVYDRPQDPTSLAKSSIEFERDLRVRQLMVGSEAVFEAAYERLTVVSTSEAATWWYIFWVRIILFWYGASPDIICRMIYGGGTMTPSAPLSFTLLTLTLTIPRQLRTHHFRDLR
jgi:hypothetical protein